MNSNYIVKPIGVFEQTSSQMIVSDPSIKNIEETTVIQVKTGIWRAYVFTESERGYNSNLGFLVQRNDLPKRGVRRLLLKKWELVASNQNRYSNILTLILT